MVGASDWNPEKHPEQHYPSLSVDPLPFLCVDFLRRSQCLHPFRQIQSLDIQNPDQWQTSSRSTCELGINCCVFIYILQIKGSHISWHCSGIHATPLTLEVPAACTIGAVGNAVLLMWYVWLRASEKPCEIHIHLYTFLFIYCMVWLQG